MDANDILTKHCGRMWNIYKAIHIDVAVQMVSDALLQPRPPLTEDEILQRARRACAFEYPAAAAAYLGGLRDKTPPMQTAMCALRNLDKPLVDSIDEKLRALVPVDDAADIALLRKAYEMGRSDVG